MIKVMKFWFVDPLCGSLDGVIKEILDIDLEPGYILLHIFNLSNRNKRY
jgi:hypothetical protein